MGAYADALRKVAFYPEPASTPWDRKSNGSQRYKNSNVTLNLCFGSLCPPPPPPPPFADARAVYGDDGTDWPMLPPSLTPSAALKMKLDLSERKAQELAGELDRTDGKMKKLHANDSRKDRELFRMASDLEEAQQQVAELAAELEQVKAALLDKSTEAIIESKRAEELHAKVAWQGRGAPQDLEGGPGAAAGAHAAPGGRRQVP